MAMSQIPAIHNALPRSLVEYKRNELSTYFHTSIHSSIYPSQQFSKLLDKRNQSKMSFNASAQNIRIEGNNLVATVSNDAGHQADASLDLNAIIGNDDGRFSWGGADFVSSAENITLSIEGDAGVPILRAQLKNIAGDLVDADLNLAERIANDNGQLVFT